MTNEEKRKMAVARELEELRKTVQSFDSVVESARRLADDCRESARRLEAIEREQEIDEKIENLDRLMERGKYAPTLVQAAENVQNFGDLARSIARTHNPTNVRPFKRES